MNRTIPFLANVLRGFLMGSADVVPGVSGGTVALIVGVYERLVGAVSRFDVRLLRQLRAGQFRDAWQYIDLAFLVSLASGIVLAVVSIGSTMETLLVQPVFRPYTLAVFLGLILASTWIVARWIEAPGGSDKVWYLSLGVAAAAVAFWITGLQTMSPEISLGYVFVCGVIGICAMILPGLSGAYLLLVLGLYSHLTDILHRLPRLDVNVHDLVTVVVFVSGCAIGLVCFSKVLKWLLLRHRAATMSVLCGLMLGALRKVWPLQTDLTPTAEVLKEKIYQPRLPQVGDPVLGCLAATLLAVLAVLAMDWWARCAGDVPQA